MKLVISGFFLIGLLALSQSSPPSTTAAAAPEFRPIAEDSTSIVDDQDDGGAICPLKWYCDDTGLFYSTKASCTSACSSVCYRDYACTGGCICP